MMQDQRPNLIKLGWDAEWEKAFAALGAKGFLPGRVAVEGQNSFVLFNEEGEAVGRPAGRLLHQTRLAADLPKVGDWVATTLRSSEGKVIIQHRLPRRTQLSRKVPGRETEEQVLAANVDLAFIVQALDRTFNVRQLERFLFMVLDAKVKPVIVLNKADIGEQIDSKLIETKKAAGNARVLVASAKTGQSMEELRQLIVPGSTVVFLGASGVGKSSLINQLYGEDIQLTMEVRESDDKGRHTTSWRELIVMKGGGVVIDTPGMREFQLWLAGGGLQESFADIEELALRCHFRACSHSQEKDCAVLAALADGRLSTERFRNFQKLKHELDYLARARNWRQPQRSSYRGHNVQRSSSYRKQARRSG